MTAKPIQTYGGMLTQDELAQRYIYINARIKFAYTEEELSFLMGRAPYYFADYERMEKGARLSDIDTDILLQIFYGYLLEGLSFERDDAYAFYEKRLIRVQKEMNDGILSYKIVHPWHIRKEKLKVNRPIQLYELIRTITPTEELKIKGEIDYVLTRLVNRGFFRDVQLPYRVFREVKKYANRHVAIYPIYLKQVLYDFLHKGKLILKTINGLMHYVSGESISLSNESIYEHHQL